MLVVKEKKERKKPGLNRYLQYSLSPRAWAAPEASCSARSKVRMVEGGVNGAFLAPSGVHEASLPACLHASLPAPYSPAVLPSSACMRKPCKHTHPPTRTHTDTQRHTEKNLNCIPIFPARSPVHAQLTYFSRKNAALHKRSPVEANSIKRRGTRL